MGSTCYEGYSLVGPALEEDLIGDINDLVVDVKKKIALLMATGPFPDEHQGETDS